MKESKPIRLLAVDVDDTLLESDIRLSEQCIDAINKAQRAGVTVVIATGRMFQSALPFAHELGLDGYMINYNGALIKKVTGETLFHEPVPMRSAQKLIGVAERLDLRLNFYIDDRLIVAEVDERVEYYQQIARVDVFPVGDLHRALSWGAPTKCLLVGDPEQTEGAVGQLKAQFPELQIDRSKPRFIEVTRLGVHKFAALTFVAQSLDITMESVMAIGDGENDITMLQGAGLGVAVANASPGAKKAADIITDHRRGAGVAEAVERFILHPRG